MKVVAEMQTWTVSEKPEPGAYSTDQGEFSSCSYFLTNLLTGNVSHVCPSFHGVYAIPVEDNAVNHTPGFTKAAGTDEAYRLTVATSKGMAGVGLRVLLDDAFAKEVKAQFEAAKQAEQ